MNVDKRLEFIEAEMCIPPPSPTPPPTLPGPARLIH